MSKYICIDSNTECIGHTYRNRRSKWIVHSCGKLQAKTITKAGIKQIHTYVLCIQYRTNAH